MRYIVYDFPFIHIKTIEEEVFFTTIIIIICIVKTILMTVRIYPTKHFYTTTHDKQSVQHDCETTE